MIKNMSLMSQDLNLRLFTWQESTEQDFFDVKSFKEILCRQLCCEVNVAFPADAKSVQSDSIGGP